MVRRPRGVRQQAVGGPHQPRQPMRPYATPLLHPHSVPLGLLPMGVTSIEHHLVLTPTHTQTSTSSPAPTSSSGPTSLMSPSGPCFSTTPPCSRCSAGGPTRPCPCSTLLPASRMQRGAPSATCARECAGGKHHPADPLAAVAVGKGLGAAHGRAVLAAGQGSGTAGWFGWSLRC